MMINHDKDCELLGGYHGCKCEIRARGRHHVLAELDSYICDQHPEDSHYLMVLSDKMNQALHEVDMEQERLSSRLKPDQTPNT